MRNEVTFETILKIGIKMAGAVGFEPTHAGSKVPCLTAWPHPSNDKY
jgi:hypothetical protein